MSRPFDLIGRAIGVGSLVLAVSLAGHNAAGTAAVATAEAFEVQPRIEVDVAPFQDAIDAIGSALDESRELLASSDERVLDDVPRDALAAEIVDAVERSQQLRDWMATYRTQQALGGAVLVPDFVLAGDVGHHPQELADARAEVIAAVEAWEAEQERIEAERRAAEERERQAAAARAAAAAPSYSAPAASRGTASPASASGGVAYSFNSIGAANQSAIDSCRGFGDTTDWLGVASFSVHWHCGGSQIANLSPGSTVRVNNGQYAGLWRANGLAYRLNGNVNTTRDVRALGGLQIQTCIGGTYSNLGYYSFTRVG